MPLSCACRPEALSATLRSTEESRFALPVTMPYRKIWPTVCCSRFAISSAPRFSTLRRDREQFGRLDLRDGPRTNLRKHVGLKARDDVVMVAGGPAILLIFTPFTRHDFEGVLGRQAGGPLLLLPRRRRVDIACQQFLCSVARHSSVRQRHDRVDAQRKGLLPPLVAIGHAPVAGAVRIDEKVQPAAIAQLLRPLAALRIADCGVGQGHVGISPFSCWYARRYTDKFVGCQQVVLGASRRHWTTYKAVYKMILGFRWMLSDAVGRSIWLGDLDSNQD